MNGDDQAWLDGLAGRGDGSPDAADGAELRRALQQRSVTAVDVPPVSPAREAVLLERARQHGPAARPGTTWRSDLRGARITRFTATLAVAAIAGLAVAVGVLLRSPGVEETVRGPAPEMLVLQAADPETLRFALVDALREAGVDARGYSLLGEHVVEVTLPVPVPEEVVRVLSEHDLPVPEGSELRIRLRAAP